LKIAKKYKSEGVPVVVGMDNHWKGTFKQRLAGLLSPWYIKPYFTDIWIPGSPQYKFAQQLGFKKQHIHKGLYCADAKLFKGNIKRKKKNEILFVGRLVDHKGVPQIISMLNRLISENKLNLRFHFIGNGPLAENIPDDKNIQHTPFVKPEELPVLLHNTGFFILPSTYEAWGVVVHEALLMGTPVISTRQCGAAIDLIEDHKNGYLFDASSFDQLEDILEKIQLMTDDEYEKMSENALKSAKQINVENWSQTLQEIGAR
jgi:glycosyltransferase involved in cell wall biosynthesis